MRPRTLHIVVQLWNCKQIIVEWLVVRRLVEDQKMLMYVQSTIKYNNNL